MLPRLSLALLVACSVAGVPRGAAAQAVDDSSRAAARKLGYSGVEAYQAGDYPTAHEKLEKSYRVLQVPSVGLWSARALVKLGKWVEASERYLELSRLTVSSGDQRVQRQALTEAAAELEALSPKIPSLIVKVEGAAASEVTVTANGAPVSAALVNEARPVNPGKYRIEGAKGSERALAEVTLGEGEQKTALLRFAPAAAVAPPIAAAPDSKPKLGPRRTLALVAGGVGLVGVGVGTIFGLKSMSRHDEAEKFCTGNQCTDARGVTAGEDAHAAGNVATVGMVIGALGLGGAVVLWVTAPRAGTSGPASEERATKLELGLGSVNVRGAF
jgi:hypothetical protein